ncbi:MAG: TIM barrel protein [Rubellimicrobium sp.]|nr:TIM barrel protein [Rubellimicrobium sp.]
MLIGNAPCSWGINYPTGNAFTWQDYLDQLAAAGYAGTELGPLGFMPTDAGLLADALGARGLTLIGATHVHTFGDDGADATDRLMAEIDTIAGILGPLGARHLVIMDESNWYPPGQEGQLDDDGWRAMIDRINAAHRRATGDHGLTLTFHPHVGTAVEREAQIDRLLAETPLSLCFDTGHHAFWDQDPLAYMARVQGRIAYMHLKNVDARVRARVLAGEVTIDESYGAGVMCALPDGAVDIPAVMAMLRDWRFEGPVVVEQDMAENAAETPEELARRNLAFLMEDGQ